MVIVITIIIIIIMSQDAVALYKKAQSDQLWHDFWRLLLLV